jgi:hypothetical protein
MSLRQDEDAMVRQRNPAYMNEEVFLEYILNVFISDMLSVHEPQRFAIQTGILLMDSALVHKSEYVLNALILIFFSALQNLKQASSSEFDHN